MRTVDVVIEGSGLPAIAATVDAARRGLRVLVVLRSRQARLVRQLRRSLRLAEAPPSHRLHVVTGAEVACVDGVNGIEAVVVRDRRTGRLTGFNTAQVLRDLHAAS